jgi:hypothetical protein
MLAGRARRVALSGKGALYGGGFAFNDPKEGARGTIGAAAALFPVLHGVQLEPETGGKIALGDTQPLAYGRHVHFLVHMRYESFAGASRIFQRLPRAAQNALTGLRHAASLLFDTP